MLSFCLVLHVPLCALSIGVAFSLFIYVSFVFHATCLYTGGMNPACGGAACRRRRLGMGGNFFRRALYYRGGGRYLCSTCGVVYLHLLGGSLYLYRLHLLPALSRDGIWRRDGTPSVPGSTLKEGGRLCRIARCMPALVAGVPYGGFGRISLFLGRRGVTGDSRFHSLHSLLAR